MIQGWSVNLGSVSVLRRQNLTGGGSVSMTVNGGEDWACDVHGTGSEDGVRIDDTTELGSVET